MKIIYDPRENDFEAMKREANRGCDKCPVCGEIKEYHFIKQKGEENFSGGIEKLALMGQTRLKGFFKPKTYTKDTYKCHTCGAKWESEEYQCV